MKTRAALFRSPDLPLEVREIDIEEPRSEDVLVRMVVVGVCGSDLHVLRGEWPRPVPMVLGHEGSGVVEAVGDSVEDLAPGDHVIISWAPACGECGSCRRGRRTACTTLREAIGRGAMLDGSTRLSIDGETVYRMTTVGALAERVIVPAQAALKVPADVPLEQAALLGCAALTGVGAVRNAGRVEPGASTIVIGAGGVGQFVVQGARVAGAAVIVAVDPLEARRESASSLGATHTVSPDGLPALAERLFPEGADFAFEAVGSAQTAELALRWTRSGGKAILVGMPAVGVKLEVDPFDFTNREKTLTGSIYGSEDPASALPRLLDYVRNGCLELAAMVGPRYPLEHVNEAVGASIAGAPGRVLVLPAETG